MNFKSLATLALAITLSLSSFANTKDNNVNDKVKSAFSEKFIDAREISWHSTSTYVKASFQVHGQSMFAFYSPDGKFLGISRNLSSMALPLKLNAELKKLTASGWIVELFEYASEEENAFYATVETADQRVFLKSLANNGWSVVKKDKKN